jgi:hypothetical protein
MAARRRCYHRVAVCRRDGSREIRPHFLPTRRSSRIASESPPGRPRRPLLSDALLTAQLSPGASTTSPDSCDGQAPVCLRWRSASSRSPSSSPWRTPPSKDGFVRLSQFVANGYDLRKRHSGLTLFPFRAATCFCRARSSCRPAHQVRRLLLSATTRTPIIATTIFYRAREGLPCVESSNSRPFCLSFSAFA